MTELSDAAACIHACQEGCGRPYDLVVVLAIDSSVLMHCIPCHQAFMVSMTKAMVEENDPQVMEVVANADLTGVMHVDPDAPDYSLTGKALLDADDDFVFDGVDE